MTPGMTILSIWLLVAEKTRHQDGRERAWPWGDGVMVAGIQKSRLRGVGEVCCSNFGIGSFSLVACSLCYTKTLTGCCLLLSQSRKGNFPPKKVQKRVRAAGTRNQNVVVVPFENPASLE
jgi:hypothetical protein